MAPNPHGIYAENGFGPGPTNAQMLEHHNFGTRAQFQNAYDLGMDEDGMREGDEILNNMRKEDLKEFKDAYRRWQSQRPRAWWRLEETGTSQSS